MRDTGVGIPPEYLPHVFDEFSQADRSLARTQGGLGIGLTLVKKLVELHGGKVEARSAGQGKGSEFTVRLPIRREPPSAGQGAGAGERGTESVPSRRVLVVEDNLDAAKILVLLLKRDGHQVEVVHDGLSAIDAARSFHPEVVLLDIGLPGIDGYEVARRIRADRSFDHPLLIAVTGYGQDEDKRRAREAGYDHHLVKPVDPVALRRLIVSEPAQPV